MNSDFIIRKNSRKEASMDHLTIPKGYESALNLHETQVAIKVVQDFFQNLLAERLK